MFTWTRKVTEVPTAETKQPVEEQCKELSEILKQATEYYSASAGMDDADNEQVITLIKWAFLAGQVKGLQHP